jgi:hypothetical protein
MNYWLDLFTGKTWEQFREAGSTVTGFRGTQLGALRRVKPGDIFLCYLTGVMRWVGALEVVGPSNDTRPIWKPEDFPVRFDVRPVVILSPEHGVPMDALEGKVEFFAEKKHRGGFRGFVRRSPNLFRRQADGALVVELLQNAKTQPISRPVDPRKLARRPMYRVQQRKGRGAVPALVSVPEPEEPVAGGAAAEGEGPTAPTSRHTEIQYHLLRLGIDMGLDVWVARNDRSKMWDGHVLGQMPRMLDEIPHQFNEATNRTIELIDVLWLRGNSIVAAFEVESTTVVYSGLLRMSDLLALQPNLNIKLYLVAPDDRRGKVEQEILRPTFSLKEKPLHDICGFLPFSKLMEKVDGIRQLGLASSLRPDFLIQTAEYFRAVQDD